MSGCPRISLLVSDHCFSCHARSISAALLGPSARPECSAPSEGSVFKLE
jgi:hypothetical protein